MGDISKDLLQNQKAVEERIENCADILLRPLQVGNTRKINCFLIYIEVAVSNLMLEDSVIGKLLDRLLCMEPEQIYGALEKNSLGISDTKELATLQEAMAAMFAGNAVLFVDGYDRAIKIGSKGYPGAGVRKAESEKVMRGSQEAFCEAVKVNTALVRKRIRSTAMKVEEQMVGDDSKTMTALLYLEGVVYPPMCRELKKRLDSFEIDGVEDGGVIEHLTENGMRTILPLYQTTERPDRAAQALLEGRAVLLTDYSPEALIFPATGSSLFQTSDDYYRHFLIVSFLRVVRYVAAFLAVTLPWLYVAAAAFHTQMLPGNLIRSMAQARSGVPFSAAAEVLLMELSFELLREAGLRMPGPIGNTIGIVGGLIVGQAAVSANLVSPITVIVAALTALGSFSIPNEELSEAFRLVKYGVLLLCAWFGILGALFGWFFLLIHMARQKSYGIPWLFPYAGGDLNAGADSHDGIFVEPAVKRTRRPIFARRGNRIRLRWKR